MNRFIARYTDEKGIQRTYFFDKSKFSKEKAEEFLNNEGIKNFYFFFEPLEPKPFGENSMMFTGEIGFDITTEILIDYISQGKDIIIDSFGGDLFEGWKIHDAIQALGINPSIGVIGTVASSAMQVLLSTENRWISENSRGLIHNPSTSIWGYVDDNELRNQADILEKEKIRLASKYANVSGKSQEEILALMEKEIFLNSDEMVAYNFAKSKKKEITNNNSNEMVDKEVTQEIGIIKSLINNLINYIKPKVKNIVMQDVNGNSIDFGEVETESQIVVGVEAAINGEPANGEYVMPDGRTFVFTSGELTEIKESEPEPQTDAKADEVKLENEALKIENNSLKVALAEKDTVIASIEAKLTEAIERETQLRNEFETKVNDLNNKLNAFLNKFSDEPIVDNLPPTETQKKSGMSWKK